MSGGFKRGGLLSTKLIIKKNSVRIALGNDVSSEQESLFKGFLSELSSKVVASNGLIVVSSSSSEGLTDNLQLLGQALNLCGIDYEIRL